MELRSTRKPRLMLRRTGVLQKRFADRQCPAKLLQPPPRITQSEPDVAPAGSVSVARRSRLAEQCCLDCQARPESEQHTGPGRSPVAQSLEDDQQTITVGVNVSAALAAVKAIKRRAEGK